MDKIPTEMLLVEDIIDSHDGEIHRIIDLEKDDIFVHIKVEKSSGKRYRTSLKIGEEVAIRNYG